jgi:succinoglycan biosynthesis protein ExoA
MQAQIEQMKEASVMKSRPLVSVVLATYNEEKSIEGCLASILRQKTSHPSIGDFQIEVLAVDGMSTDGTRALLERFARRDPRLRILDNQRRRAPFAFNLGLHHAHGDYVCIFGAHSEYRDDYIAVCLAELLAHDAAACGGRVKTAPASRLLNARLSAWTMSHSFGSSRKSFRTQQEGPVDTVNYAVFRRDLVLAAGGYDQDLLRNQDNDLNQKLRAAGFLLWCTWKTECLYFPTSTVRGLFRYAYGNGNWNAVSLARNPASMALRHFVPFFFVVSLACAAFLVVAGCVARVHNPWMAAILLAALLGLHLTMGTAAAIDVAVRERALGALWLPLVFLGFHFSYGFGTLRGLLSQPWTAWLARERAHRDSVPLGD